MTKMPRPTLRRKTRFHEILNLLVFMVAVYVLLEMAAPRSIVLSISMNPTLVENERLLISRVSYLFGQPQRGEIVVFEPPGHIRGEPPLIKRLIGLPGETVELREQAVYINGVMLEEAYLPESCQAMRCPDREWTLGIDEFFMMGDNRNHSRDSREFGPIPRRQVVGRAILRWWPPAVWGVLTYNSGEMGVSLP
ncbi:MAG: signal peptidase I [Anaerolineae bacterium]|nr:signal peptidase I [Anaerolineae bacterium]